jgi:hypothetical protein
VQIDFQVVVGIKSDCASFAGVRSCQFVQLGHGDRDLGICKQKWNISHGDYQAVSGLAYIDAVELILWSGYDDAVVISLLDIVLKRVG